MMLRAGQQFSLCERRACARCRAPSAKMRAGAADKPVSAKRPFKVALLFDCDGVIVETEELHRLAYNAAFTAFDLTIDGEPVQWSTEYYDVLQNTVGGGKPKMKHHFNKFGWPASISGPGPVSEATRNALVDELQDKKTEHYKSIVDQAAEARPGVLKLMDEGLDHPDVAVCICSASTKEGFIKLVDAVVGEERLKRFDVILAGDDVTKKKPDPLIYNMARERLGILADKCLVIEDSMPGLRAAIGAGMHCVITPTSSTDSGAFEEEGAGAVLQTLESVTVNDLFAKVMGPDWVRLEPVKTA
ncbi:HAD-like domain-containing protein [Dunaliella salina]|uniref:HAD-like domain-containing protein n=1 Tax=Dunaliella salina TaxID=3046 RepID=A0ABQ7GDK2_DUNSA|nr:HAD-like domain-containing protein [Dunaliella salina]|eukprot:KAF5832639.1 HAD-like domain-containing protein [Dunaliella salina]